MRIVIGGQVEGLEIGGLVMGNGTTRDIEGTCELRYSGCTGLGELREDPYEADVNDNPGEMMLACDECTQERRDGI